ncbi:protein kinase [Rhypophila decipiens]|uniref:Protein kinase n=1 Tax=Rhypophila decipiens TaxID=261697 RepID=A0AAN7B2U6_9PEZI|nr:protein kinase [Rhypophila decipiens]
MDPLSLGGVGLAVASLSFELFSACIKCSSCSKHARNMPKTARYLLVRLRMEKEKLLGWAILANLSEDDERRAGAGLRLNQHTIVETLQQIQLLLLDFSRLEKRYSLELVADPTEQYQGTFTNSDATESVQPEFTVLQKKALGFTERTRKYPKRLKWATFDKAKFEDLLSALGVLNDNMMAFLESHERARHIRMQEATFMQVLQVNNRVNDLLKLVDSLQRLPQRHKPGMGDFEERVIRLTQFKTTSLALDNPLAQDPWLEAKRLSHLTQENAEVDGCYRSLAVLDGHESVWIEWRYYADSNSGSEYSDSESEMLPSCPPFLPVRISRLALLLGNGQKPQEFLVPHCVGCVHDAQFRRFGFVFQTPVVTTETGHPRTLFGFLAASETPPSMSNRIRIARKVATALWYLHATDWLHKGPRSENVLFVQSDRGGPPHDPLLCGFDYSRPAAVGEETERPLENLLHDMYRHPDIQFDVPREGRGGFTKYYDMYSLGVLLYEIAMWKPIYKCLGVHIPDPESIKTTIVKNVRDVLTSPWGVGKLRAEAGDIFTDAVMTCLDRGQLQDITQGGLAQSDPNPQFHFGEKVVRRLESIVI